MADYLQKVIKLEILKPTVWVGGALDGQVCTWKTLSQTLRTVQYFSARIANHFITDRYVETQMKRLSAGPDFQGRKMAEINKTLRAALIAEGKHTEEELNRFSKNGCLIAVVIDALKAAVIDPQISGSNWRDVLAANASLPSYKRRIPVCIRCDKPEHKRITKRDEDYTLDLNINVGSKIRIVLATRKLDGSQKTILDRLCNPQSGYTQQTMQIAYNERRNKWFLSCTFRFPPTITALDESVIVGADLGYSCPLFAAVSNNDHARIGRREFDPISQQVKRLQSQTIRRRNLLLSAGRASFVADTNRGGHGRKRRIKSIQRFEDKINNAYKTLNHQISRRLIDFALKHNAGVIQIEDLKGLQKHLTGTFLGQRWRYYELQQMVAYKAKEQGVLVREVDARYTSRRCCKCGHINADFTREWRDKNKPEGGGVALFWCPACGESAVDPDFNAARNLCVADIGKVIQRQAKKQKLVGEDDSEPDPA
jgi:IS605 OrfB family transposase